MKTCLVNRDLKLVYAYIPKAACTSIKAWLVDHANFYPALAADVAQARAKGLKPGDAGFPNIHRRLDNECSLTRLPAEDTRAILADPAFFKFTFVRNPLPRLVSAYLDKVVLGKPPAWRIMRTHQFWNGRLGLRHAAAWLRGKPFLDLERRLTFREFLTQLSRERPNSLDVHFRSQARLRNGLPLDFIGRFENLAADFAVIQQRLNQFAPLPQRHSRPYANESAGAACECVADWPAARFRDLPAAPAWRRFFDTSLLAIADRVYAADFAQFGYRCDLEHDGPSLSRVSA